MDDNKFCIAITGTITAGLVAIVAIIAITIHLSTVQALKLGYEQAPIPGVNGAYWTKAKEARQ